MIPFPGTHYVGPGTISELPPTSHADAVAQEHDEKYDQLIAVGQDPYFTWNNPDVEAWDAVSGDYSYPAIAMRTFFYLKRKAAELGLIEDLTRTRRAKRRRVRRRFGGKTAALRGKRLQSSTLPPAKRQKRLQLPPANRYKRQNKIIQNRKPTMPMLYLRRKKFKAKKRRPKRNIKRKYRKRRYSRRKRNFRRYRKMRDRRVYGAQIVKITDDYGVLQSPVNQVQYFESAINTFADMNSYCDQYYSVDDGVLTQTNLGNFVKQGVRGYTVSQVTIRNNCSHSCFIKPYYFRYKVNTDSTFNTLYTDGIDDFFGNNGYETSPSLFPKHATLLFKKLRLLKTGKAFKLNPGSTRELIFKSSFLYSSDEDAHISNVYSANGTALVVLRVQGGLVHDDTTTSNVGLAAVQVDYRIKKTATFRHFGFNQVPRHVLEDNIDTIAAAVQHGPDIEENTLAF